jgi:hypothetical protein
MTPMRTIGKMDKMGISRELCQGETMSAVLQQPRTESPLQGLDPSLSFIASRAAIELDNLLLGLSDTLDAVQQLASRLKNSAEEVSGTSVKRNLMDPEAMCVFSQAFAQTQGHSVSTVDELANEAWRIASDLHQAKSDARRQTLEALRSFCVALSRIASAQRMAMLDQNPGFPFER